MSRKNKIQVLPDSIVFREIAVGENDFADVYITNTGDSTVRVRCSIDHNSPFILSNEGTISIPPGIEVKVSVSYEAKDSNVYKTDLYIETKISKITIPIKAFPPGVHMTTDINSVELGKICINDEHKFVFSITNIGVKEGFFEIDCSESGIHFNPQSGTLSPNQTQVINSSFKTEKLGDFKIPINIESQSIEKCPPIEVKGSALQSNVILLFEGKETSEFDFQTVYYHQKRVIRAKILNNGLLRRSFVVFPSQDRPTTTQTGKSNATKTQEMIDKTFSAYPNEGLLEPNKSETINFIFQPEPENNQMIDDVENLYSQFTYIEIVETGQKIDLQFNGKAVFHQVKLSKVDFTFDKCKVNAKSAQILTILNDSHFLSTNFEIPPIAQFRFEPSKGEIPSGEKKNITIVFYPRNLGDFENAAKILFMDGIFHKHINLIGQCGNPNEKPFKRIPIYETDETAKFFACHPDKRYSYGIDEIKQNTMKRLKFDSYITEQASRRARITAKSQLMQRSISEAKSELGKIGQYTKDDLNELVQQKVKEHELQNSIDGNDLGLVHCEGLKPPDPPIKLKPSPLFVLHPEKFGVNKESQRSQTAFQSRKKLVIENCVLPKKKIKAKPSTPQEINDCARTLTPAQQLMINGSHEKINFGTVSVFSTNSKLFSISNNLQQYVIVNLQIDCDELSQTNPLTQVIPPYTVTNFEIKFSCKNPMNFLHTIHYVINGHHSNSFTVSAQVVPIEVQLSRSIIEFRFTPDSITPIIKEFVSATNNSIGSAQYTWTGMNNFFSISQVSGTIEPNKVYNFEITYSPTRHSHDETTMIMNIVGGQSRALRCIGDIGAPKLSLSKKIIDFGLIPIGIAKTQQIRLKNSGDDDALFSISHEDLSEISITPENGKVTAHDGLNFQINIKATQEHQINVPVTISIAGAQPIIFSITAKSEFPSVQIQNNEFEFGRHFVGSSSSLNATISNDGSIPAILYLDLSPYPEFHIEFQADLAEIDEKSNSISIVSDTVFVTKSENQKSDNSSSNSYADDQSDDEDNPKKVGKIYKIYIIEKTSVSFNLVFQPTQPGDHSFELPITMMNVTSSSSFHLQPIVSAEAIQAPLWVSDSIINFDVSPIYDQTNPHSRPIVRQIWIRNDHKTAIKWRFDLSDNLFKSPAIFSVEPSSGSIEFNQSKSLHLSFMPKKAIPYLTHLSIYVTIDDEESIIGQLQLTGVGTKYLYKMSTNHVCLPIVPLNVKSQMDIFVLNVAFIETNLTVNTAIDEKNFPLKIKFPNGQKLEHTTDKLPLSISFVSSKPMSFSTMIALTDDFGGATTFEVSCTTDNSMFTLYPFFSDKEIIVKSGNGKPIIYENKTPYKQLNELTARFLVTSDIKDLKGEIKSNWNPSFNDIMVQFIQRYLNTLIMTSQITSFPKDFIQNDFQLLIEAIRNLSNGKKIQVDGDRTDYSKDPITKRRDSALKIIRFLESYGALLSSIKPEFLLPKVDFLQIMKNKLNKQFLGLDYFDSPDVSALDQKVVTEFTSSKAYAEGLLSRMKIFEELYHNLSRESWMIVIMQMLKIFTLNKITPERFTKTNGVANSIKAVQALSAQNSTVDELLSEVLRPTKSINSSNIFSQSEGILLKWISINHCSIMNDLQKTVTTFDSLKDSLALSSLIKAHTTSVKMSMDENPTDKAVLLNNAIEFTTALKELKLGFSPRTNEIIDGSSCILALTSAYLFETLPFFLPQSTLEFTTSLHKPITRNVTISNNSKAEVRYTATLEAGSGYSLSTDTFIIGPNQSIDVPITFSARTIKPISGRIFLSPSRPRYVSSNSNQQTNEASPDQLSGPQTSRESGRKPPPQMPIFSSPVVVDLISEVTVSQPDETHKIEGLVYEPTKITIPIKNYIGLPCSLRLISRVTQIAKENGAKINQKKTLQDQIVDLLNKPYQEEIKSDDKDLSPFDSYIKKHKMFIFNQQIIEFTTKESEVELEVEFIPITIGVFRCLLAFEDENSGEFIIEIIAKSTLPPPTEVSSGKFKTEANKSFSSYIQVDQINTNLMKALAYSIEKSSFMGANISERKLRDMLSRRQHEFEGLFRQSFQSQQFSINNSSAPFFEVPPDVTVYKQAFSTTAKEGKNVMNSIHVTFTPTKAGEYPCKLLLFSPFDIRLLSFKGIGIAATKELKLSFSSVVGQVMKQDIPLNNVSDAIWNYKVTLTGDKSFTAPNRLAIKPKTSSSLPITFTPHRIGTFNAEATIMNLTKETTVIYKLRAQADEPPAEEKVVIDCQARQLVTKKLSIKTALIKSGNIQVTTTIPIISFKSDISFQGGDTTQVFEYNIYAQRSGVAAGTITFTDLQTKNYIWYILEIHVSAPSPEQVIEVTTEARKSATVRIPIANPKQETAKFNVVLSDDDLFGSKVFNAAPGTTTDYILVVSPLKMMNRISSVYFYSDDDGEFWYKVHIDAKEPSPNTLAPLTSPLGKFSSTFIVLENPLEKVISFRIDNDNPTVFHVLSKRVLQLNPMEKKRIEVRYIPTNLGVKEMATIGFKSNEIGDWTYKLTGTGKPPQPLSPIIVSSPLNTTSSALVLFSNPFPYPCRFSATMGKNDQDKTEIFRFLAKKKVFSLSSFGEEYQIPFTFTPPALGQFQTNIIIASLGDERSNKENTDSLIQWVFPIIGNSLMEKTNDVKYIKCRAQENYETDLTFSLVGEKELFDANDYKSSVQLPNGYEFVNYFFDIKPKEVTRTEDKTEIIISFRLSLQRPLQILVPFTIKNPLGQEWQFQIDIRVERGKPTATIQIESLLNKSGSTVVSVPTVFREQTPFHAYFANGSALEFTVQPEHGFIPPSFAMTESWTELPITVVFAPKMYGKLLKGLLVIDTLNSQFLFEVEGKTPEYVPPIIPNGTSHSRLDNLIKQEDIQRMQPKRDKRKIIKENIEMAKKPRITAPQVIKK